MTELHLHPTGADDDATITRAIARQQAELDGVQLLPAGVADELEHALPRVRPLHVLVACEFSGTVRDAFAALGHDAISCDLLPSERPGRHWQGDVRQLLAATERPFDLVIAHPPCDHLAVSGARWFAEKRADGRQQAALEFVRVFMELDVPRVAIENPVSIISSKFRKPDQIVQPWQFGHGETKATCLWLKGLPKLQPTDVVDGRENRVHRMAPSPDRWRERSRTFPGLAAAMAEQWGGDVR